MVSILRGYGEAVTPSPRISEGADKLGLRVLLPDAGRFYVAGIFTTLHGSWEPSQGNVYSVPQWARDTYLTPRGAPDYFDDAGASTHLFARVEDARGTPIPTDIYWTSNGNWADATKRNTGEKRHGWQNIPIFGGGSTFYPEQGQQGPWMWGPEGGPYVVGGGLPASEHVSSFAVWRERPEPVPVPVDPLPSRGIWTATRADGDTVFETHTARTIDDLIDRIMDGAVGVSGRVTVTQE